MKLTYEFVIIDKEQQVGEIHLFDNEKDLKVVIDLDEDFDYIHALIDNIQDFINKYKGNEYVIEIKNDNDMLGIIVDVWNHKASDDIIDTACIWFDDYIEDEPE